MDIDLKKLFLLCLKKFIKFKMFYIEFFFLIYIFNWIVYYNLNYNLCCYWFVLNINRVKKKVE